MTTTTLAVTPPLPGLAGLQPLRGSRPLLPSKSLERTTPQNEPETLAVNVAPSDGIRSEAIDCPDSRWVKGTCVKDGQIRWLKVPCKKRTCSTCGPAGRTRIASDIAFEIRMGMIADKRYAFMVLTFDDERAENSDFKPIATRKVASFVRWLRQKQGMPDLEYVQTYELQKSGRLHINLIAGPWKYVSHPKLLGRWGARISCEYVKDSGSIGTEAAAAYSPEGLGGYISKLEQAVPEDWGRRVSFSHGWRRVPKAMREPERKGEIRWEMPDRDELLRLDSYFKRGKIIRVREGEFAYGDQYYRHPECECFDFKGKRRKRPPSSLGDDITDESSYESMREWIATGGRL